MTAPKYHCLAEFLYRIAGGQAYRMQTPNLFMELDATPRWHGAFEVSASVFLGAGMAIGRRLHMKRPLVLDVEIVMVQSGFVGIDRRIVHFIGRETDDASFGTCVACRGEINADPITDVSKMPPEIMHERCFMARHDLPIEGRYPKLYGKTREKVRAAMEAKLAAPKRDAASRREIAAAQTMLNRLERPDNGIAASAAWDAYFSFVSNEAMATGKTYAECAQKMDEAETDALDEAVCAALVKAQLGLPVKSFDALRQEIIAIFVGALVAREKSRQSIVVCGKSLIDEASGHTVVGQPVKDFEWIKNSLENVGSMDEAPPPQDAPEPAPEGTWRDRPSLLG